MKDQISQISLMMRIFRVLILIGLAAPSFCGQDYDSVLNAVKDGTLSRKLTPTLGKDGFYML